MSELVRLVEQIDEERLVAYVTGHGLKTADVIGLPDGNRVEIDASLKSFREMVHV